MLNFPPSVCDIWLAGEHTCLNRNIWHVEHVWVRAFCASMCTQRHVNWSTYLPWSRKFAVFIDVVEPGKYRDHIYIYIRIYIYVYVYMYIYIYIYIYLNLKVCLYKCVMKTRHGCTISEPNETSRIFCACKQTRSMDNPERWNGCMLDCCCTDDGSCMKTIRVAWSFRRLSCDSAAWNFLHYPFMLSFRQVSKNIKLWIMLTCLSSQKKKWGESKVIIGMQMPHFCQVANTSRNMSATASFNWCKGRSYELMYKSIRHIELRACMTEFCVCKFDCGARRHVFLRAWQGVLSVALLLARHKHRKKVPKFIRIFSQFRHVSRQSEFGSSNGCLHRKRRCRRWSLNACDPRFLVRTHNKRPMLAPKSSRQ